MPRPPRAVWVAAAAVAVAGGSLLLLARGEPPEALDDLRRAREAGDEAAGDAEKIAERLEEMAANLRQGAGLAEQSEEIRSLTARQRASLAKVVGILQDQLDALERSNRALRGSRSATEDLARLSERQSRLLERTLASLRTLERAAERSSSFSADVAQAARYGARLAEDSADNFSRP